MKKGYLQDKKTGYFIFSANLVPKSIYLGLISGFR